MSLKNEDLKKMLYWMILGRRLEERITTLFRESRLRGHHHPGIGQEAANVGSTYCLEAKDWVNSTHRGKLSDLIKGMSLRDLMAGYFAKKEGLEGGRAPTGSHMYGDLSLGVLPFTGVIGSVIPVATGVALGMKLDGQGAVMLCTFGDGASNRGDFHEGLNMAAAYKLPAVYLLVNNGYAMSVSVERATGMKDLSARAASYGIPGVSVDGNDVMAVYEATREAVDLARRGGGPSLIECRVHRWTGHSITDADIYRTDEDRAAGEKKDCVARFKKELMGNGVMTEQEIEQLEADVKQEIDDVVHYCEHECTDPDPADILRGVYAA